MPGVCLILTKTGGYSEVMIPTVIKSLKINSDVYFVLSISTNLRLILCLQIYLQVGFNMKKITKGNVTIKLWDLGGQPRFRSMWERYCRAVSAIVYAF